MLIISDTAALSALAEADLMQVLPSLFPSIVITEAVRIEAVRIECSHPGGPVALRQWIGSPPAWLSVVADPATLLFETGGLGAGEAASISLAWEHRLDSLVILDDLLARKIAIALGLNVIGLLAIIADAARAGIVEFESTVNRLRAVDFHMSQALIERARQRAHHA